MNHPSIQASRPQPPHADCPAPSPGQADPRLCNVLLLAAVLFSAAVAAAAGVSLIVATAAWPMVRRAPRSPRSTSTALASQDSRTPKIPWGFIRILAMSSPARQHEPCPTWKAGSRNSRTAILCSKYGHSSDGKEVPAHFSTDQSTPGPLIRTSNRACKTTA